MFISRDLRPAELVDVAKSDLEGPAKPCVVLGGEVRIG